MGESSFLPSAPIGSAAQLGNLLPADGGVVRAVQEVRQFLSPQQLHEPQLTTRELGSKCWKNWRKIAAKKGIC